jgi:hypothetical protein
MRRVVSGLSANRRVSTSFQVIRERTAARSIEQRLQMCVATNAGSEAVAIGLPKCVDASVASFLTDLPVAFTSVIAAEALFLSPLALSNSFFWHATLISDSSEPEPYSQLRIRVRSSTALRSAAHDPGMPKASSLNAQRPSARILPINALETVDVRKLYRSSCGDYARFASRRIPSTIHIRSCVW